MDHAETASALNQRALKWIGIMLLTGGVLVATHAGEFWPFSIYPMFSRAGRPWERSLVRRVDRAADSEIWAPRELETVIGQPLALAPLDIPQNDMTKLVKLTKHWDEARIGVLRGMFEEPLSRGERLLLYRIRGDLDAEGHGRTLATPFLLMEPDGTTRFNPQYAPGAQQGGG
jgi:hypothetical protein